MSLKFLQWIRSHDWEVLDRSTHSNCRRNEIGAADRWIDCAEASKAEFLNAGAYPVAAEIRLFQGVAGIACC